MSVVRTARLLTVTTGTTTIMHSLKTARPLLTSVAYFVVFAMVLFSIIGMQSFQGSLRRTCHLEPTLGEQEIQLSNQFCGGYIDPVTLNTTAFIDSNNQAGLGTIKGYICPLGQVCREDQNPYSNIESFDTIYYAALQIVIVASVNGVCLLFPSTEILLTPLTVVAIDVRDDRLRVFHILFLFHHRRDSPQLLVNQPVRRSHYQHL